MRLIWFARSQFCRCTSYCFYFFILTCVTKLYLNTVWTRIRNYKNRFFRLKNMFSYCVQSISLYARIVTDVWKFIPIWYLFQEGHELNYNVWSSEVYFSDSAWSFLWLTQLTNIFGKWTLYESLFIYLNKGFTPVDEIVCPRCSTIGAKNWYFDNLTLMFLYRKLFKTAQVFW